jgi:hypothetical protein
MGASDHSQNCEQFGHELRPTLNRERTLRCRETLEKREEIEQMSISWEHAPKTFLKKGFRPEFHVRGNSLN